MYRSRRRVLLYPLPPSLAPAAALALLALAGLLVPAAVSGQAAPDAREAATDVFVDLLEVDVVNLEVQVVDGDGYPVRGLGRDDFVVLEDGEPVELTNFYEVQAARRVLPPEETPGEEDHDLLVQLPPDQALHLAVVVDVLNLSPASRQGALAQVRRELDRVMRPGDRVMVAALESVPRVVQPFSGEPRAVFAALDRIAASKPAPRLLELQRERIHDLLAEGRYLYERRAERSVYDPDLPRPVRPEDFASDVQGLVLAYAEQADLRMRGSFAALDALVSSLSGLPGRKAVLLVSEGLSTNPALEMYEAFLTSLGATSGSAFSSFQVQRYDLSDVLHEVTRNAAANRVTFYALDARSARALPSAGADRPRLAAEASSLLQQDALVQLAAATGGVAMLNAGNARALLARMAGDYSDYYSLGYVSDHGRDGRFHRLQVRVPGLPGARVRHTEGYRAKPLARQMADRALSALILDVAQNPLEVRIELGEEQAGKRDEYVLPVRVKVPVAKLALVPGRNVHQGKVSIALAVQDAAGGLSEPRRVEVPVEIPNDELLQAMGREVGYGLDLRVRGGSAKLAVAVRDEVAATESTVNLNIDVGGG